MKSDPSSSDQPLQARSVVPICTWSGTLLPAASFVKISLPAVSPSEDEQLKERGEKMKNTAKTSYSSLWQLQFWVMFNHRRSNPRVSMHCCVLTDSQLFFLASHRPPRQKRPVFCDLKKSASMALPWIIFQGKAPRIWFWFWFYISVACDEPKERRDPLYQLRDLCEERKGPTCSTWPKTKISILRRYWSSSDLCFQWDGFRRCER